MSDGSHAHLRFAECGLSARTGAVLIKTGVDTPERLLAMTAGHIRLIQGIGPTLLKEIEQYRARATGAG